ncbi:hypothetical protein KL86CLO1_12873 [uncultured Eubacteriales bacterium]|uniref:Uncharacterized protein n=1 Tax=uncultured Eubacteriales bacterium TaxID=172733 RepID=A0A212KEQ8_9FIRM|nr:hypothetical protein KL86CLO1_12873 [uncultured Eubacteriales bacterium]
MPVAGRPAGRGKRPHRRPPHHPGTGIAIIPVLARAKTGIFLKKDKFHFVSLVGMGKFRYTNLC